MSCANGDAWLQLGVALDFLVVQSVEMGGEVVTMAEQESKRPLSKPPSFRAPNQLQGLAAVSKTN